MSSVARKTVKSLTGTTGPSQIQPPESLSPVAPSVFPKEDAPSDGVARDSLREWAEWEKGLFRSEGEGGAWGFQVETC